MGREGSRHGLEAFTDLKYACLDLGVIKETAMLERALSDNELNAWDRDHFFHPSTHMAGSMRAARRRTAS